MLCLLHILVPLGCLLAHITAVDPIGDPGSTSTDDSQLELDLDSVIDSWFKDEEYMIHSPQNLKIPPVVDHDETGTTSSSLTTTQDYEDIYYRVSNTLQPLFINHAPPQPDVSRPTVFEILKSPELEINRPTARRLKGEYDIVDETPTWMKKDSERVRIVSTRLQDGSWLSQTRRKRVRGVGKQKKIAKGIFTEIKEEF
ncbi:hypothetical protein NEOLI_003415 [Neolecta irregularis DAH-3]|uniref:Uncharacterized protein n=1 Tax=Neolecta irregularis (strain DAH-3) TaxID=1198029 RepID=A0A1U7LRA5_NEOID|nr:hypothetical protein NEOLI_003415 [Neolecta irregularis DAH-3]|eukprot:OLL25195.1 hypothetical protein NEOLI_003415 [Neolecta irregularis DAH-3]